MAKQQTKKPLPKISIQSINSIKFRDDNPRHHSAENLELIQHSIRRNKAGRSILIDENDESLAGEGTTRSAIDAGIKEVIVIETTGDQLVAVKRTDLSEDQKAEMILFDNRANETSDWDNAKTAEMLARLKAAGSEVSVFGFTDADLEHFQMNGTFTDEDYEKFFTPADDHHKSDPGKLSIHFVYDKAVGEKVLEKLIKHDPKPENALLKLLKIPIPKEPKKKAAKAT